MSSVPLAKRKRCDLTESAREIIGIEGIKRSQSLWFDDGNVILQAQKTQFRVHRSVMCNYSKVFQDMFTVPQPEISTVVEGAPLVHVVDEAVDWENVLNIIYFGLKMHDEYSVDSLISMMRLGHKYQFDDIKATAIKRLTKEFPSSFSDWTTGSVSDPHDTILKREHFSKGHEIDLINIALEVECQQILPALYYIFLRDRPLTDIFDGTMRKDKTFAILSPETQRTLVLGRNNILRAIATHILGWLSSDISDDCSACNGQQKRIAVSIVGMLHHDVSIALQDTCYALVSDMCPECREMAEEEMAQGRQDLWNDLPLYFSLPSWDVLAKFNN